MQHGNFQKKTGTKQLTHNHHLYLCPRSRPRLPLLRGPRAQSPTRHTDENPGGWTTRSLPGDAERLHQFFFFDTNMNKHISIYLFSKSASIYRILQKRTTKE